jgi:hypothetical protein
MEQHLEREGKVFSNSLPPPPSFAPRDTPPRFQRLVGTAEQEAIPAGGELRLTLRLRWPGWLTGLTRLVGGRAFIAPALAFVAVAGYFTMRSLLQVTPEGDSTLHLHLMETISNGELPKVVPHFAAVVGEGGQIQHYFPYSYPLFYHLVGGALFKAGGEGLATLLGPICAGLSAMAIMYLLRGQPWPLRTLAVTLPFLQWITQPVMAWVYMEPLMLACFLAGLCFYQRAWANRAMQPAIVAGVFFGLAVATRQNALFCLLFVSMHGVGTMVLELLNERPALRPTIGRYLAMGGSAVVVAAPFLLYLIWTSGTIAYADVRVPGFEPAVSTDSQAIEYLRSFSVPLSGPMDWLEQYWDWTLYTSRWQFGVLKYAPIPLFVVGIIYLATRGDRMSLFLASYVPVHVLGEMLQLMTVHGNWRYVVVSRVLFYVVVAVGLWQLPAWVYRTVTARARWEPAVGVLAAALTIAVILPGFLTFDLVRYLATQEGDRTEKGESFKELGAYIEKHVPEDALILSGRWYTTGYYARRDYTWVTYYGNTWVIDAISSPDAEAARGTLERYGVDYVIFQAPPPSYLDSMPSQGLRTIVLEDLEHFQLLFRNERTRLYRFWPDGIP